MDLRWAVHRLLTGHRVRLSREVTRQLQHAAEQAFIAASPGRQPNGSVLWAVDGEDVIVCVYQRWIRPSNAPTFVRVGTVTGTATMVPGDEYARYWRPLVPLK